MLLYNTAAQPRKSSGLRIIDMDGVLVLTNVAFNSENIVQHEWLEDREAEEEYEGYMGNSVRCRLFMS